MKSEHKYLVLAIASLAAASFGCDDSSSATITYKGCQSGFEACGDSCCLPGNCDADNICRDSDNNKCGADLIECDDNEVCENGKCISVHESCAAPYKVCEGSCISISKDPMNCGDCGVQCDELESCNDGVCVKGCADGYTLINGQCYNTNIDSEHCSQNNIACGDNQYCAEDKSDNTVKCMCMNGFYDCDQNADNGCESDTECEYICGEAEKSCGPGMCCPESSTCCGSSCCTEGTTCCGNDSCYDLSSDPRHCGGCSNECQSNEICFNGICLENTEQTCEDPEQSICWGECVNLMTDSQNCESCGKACEEGFECKEAQCIIACPEGMTACGDTCIDLTSDNMHCGACDNKCTPDTQCITDEERTACKATSEVNPELVCNTEEDLATEGYVPKLECWGQCIDGTSDIANCGSCGNQCNEGYVCKDSVCVYHCAEGMTACGETCTDLTSDNMNCGACDNKCTPDTQCITDEEGTACRATSEVNPELVCNTEEDLATEGYIPKLECWGQCIDSTTDNDNCGACGNVCAEGTECKDSVCEIVVDPEKCDAPGYGLCFGSCINLMENDYNCGACLNSCGNGEKCTAGKCELQCEELTNCGGACIDISKSANNCGACGNKCAAGQACIDSKCQCEEGKHNCDGIDANGCESDIKCECNPGESRSCWRGDEANVNKDGNNNIVSAKGACQLGRQTCDKSGRFWSPCTGGKYPSALTCNESGTYIGGDQNCNGIDDTTEECVSKCDLIRSADSYIGCEYWPVYLPNLPSEAVEYKNHTVLVSNPNSTTVKVYIYRINNYTQSTPAPYLQKEIAPGSVEIIQLSTRLDYMLETSWGNSPSTIEDKSYLLRASLPVTVYQFNPWDGSLTYTADASLLLPANVFGKKYMIMNWSPNKTTYTSNSTIVATAPGKTKVTVKTKAAIASGTGINPMSIGDTQTFDLTQFQILNLTTGDISESRREQTGTIITADKEIAVYAGMKCSHIPHNVAACDHLEEMLFPVQSWGKEYFAVPVERRGSSSDFWRIVASENNTTVTLPTSLGGNKTLNEGEFLQIETTETFEIKSNKPISVGQFIAGEDYKNAGKGDPAFGLAVPFEQYRSDYYFSVPSSYSENYVTIIMPNDGTLKLDGVNFPTSDFTKIGTSGFKYKYYKISSGTHQITGSKPFGLIGYGYSPYISYLYPIGLDLKKINNTN